MLYCLYIFCQIIKYISKMLKIPNNPNIWPECTLRLVYISMLKRGVVAKTSLDVACVCVWVQGPTLRIYGPMNVLHKWVYNINIYIYPYRLSTYLYKILRHSTSICTYVLAASRGRQIVRMKIPLTCSIYIRHIYNTYWHNRVLVVFSAPPPLCMHLDLKNIE